MLLGLVAGCHDASPPAFIPPATPGLEPSRESYATARSHFQTTLIREGPANQLHEPLVTPANAVRVAYQSDGRTLQAFASPIVATAQRQPAVLFLHGGFTWGEGHWNLARSFRDAGFVVLMPTLRGENGQQGACSLFYDEVDDVLAAGTALAARPDVDPTQIFLAGHSVGGTLTLLAALVSGQFRAAASFSASPDVIEFTRGRTDRNPFDPDQIDEFRMRSAVAFATGFRCPLRMFYGEDEFWLHSPTLRTVALAQGAGLDVRAVELPGGHDSVTPASAAAAISFFRVN